MRGNGRGLNAQWKVFSHFLYSQRCVYLSNKPVSQSKTTRAVTTASTLQKPRLPFSLHLFHSEVAGSWFLSPLWDRVLNKGLRLNSITDVWWWYRWTHTCFHLLYWSCFTRLLQYGYVSKRKPEVCFLYAYFKQEGFVMTSAMRCVCDCSVLMNVFHWWKVSSLYINETHSLTFITVQK